MSLVVEIIDPAVSLSDGSLVDWKSLFRAQSVDVLVVTVGRGERAFLEGDDVGTSMFFTEAEDLLA